MKFKNLKNNAKSKIKKIPQIIKTCGVSTSHSQNDDTNARINKITPNAKQKNVANVPKPTKTNIATWETDLHKIPKKKFQHLKNFN